MKRLIACMTMMISLTCLGVEDRNLISAKVELRDSSQEATVIQKAELLKEIKGMKSIWVSRSGEKSWGIFYFQEYDGSKEDHVKAVNEVLTALGGKKAVGAWDISSKVMWIKR